MRHSIKVLVVAAMGSVFAASVKEVTVSKQLQAAMQDIAVHSKVVTVGRSGITAGTFHEDSDPMTLQLVIRAKPSDGAAQVSSDGEVIFLQKNTSGKEQQSVFKMAFYLKAKAREAASLPASAHNSSP